MRTYHYHRVDVFTDQPFAGNPVAVFPAAEGLESHEMQRLAREMNLSETVFCLPPRDPNAELRLRIFTVDRELPLAGHPVVGTLYVLAQEGKVAFGGHTRTVSVELDAGVLPVELVAKRASCRVS